MPPPLYLSPCPRFLLLHLLNFSNLSLFSFFFFSYSSSDLSTFPFLSPPFSFPHRHPHYHQHRHLPLLSTLSIVLRLPLYLFLSLPGLSFLSPLLADTLEPYRSEQARLRDTGEDVAIKVRRPGVEPLIYRDLYIFRQMAGYFNWYTTKALGCNAQVNGQRKGRSGRHRAPVLPHGQALLFFPDKAQAKPAPNPLANHPDEV